MQSPTVSKDGEYRITVEVKHRIGADALVLAACEIVEHEMIHSPSHPDAHTEAETILADTSMAAIERKVRERLADGGRNWIDFGHEQLFSYDLARSMAEAKVHELWPQLWQRVSRPVDPPGGTKDSTGAEL